MSRRLGMILAWLSLTMAPAALAQPDQALLERIVEVDLPAQPLAQSLITLSRQAGVQILATTAAVRQRDTAELRDRLPLREILDRLLADSPLVYRVVSPGVIGVDLRGTAAPTSVIDLDELVGATGEAAESRISDRDTQPVLAQPRRRVIDEIIVTATKREESLRDIPASIVAIRGDELEKMGAQGQDDFIKLVPGVTLQDNGADARKITIRGISSGRQTSATAGILVNDAPFNSPYFPLVTLDPNPFDLANIEVLKGPQGTLFGGSALNGAVRYVTNKPVIGQWEAKAFASFESVADGGGGRVFGAAVNIPVADRDDLALRLVALDRSSAGWVDEFQRGEIDVNRKSQTASRVLALWEPDELWTVSGMYLGEETAIRDSAITDNNQGRPRRSNTPRPSPILSSIDFWTLGISRSFTGFDVLAQTTHAKERGEGNVDASRAAGDRPPPNILNDFLLRNVNTGQEFRLSSNPDHFRQWQWVAGAIGQRFNAVVENNFLLSGEQTPADGRVLEEFFPGFQGTVSADGQLNGQRVEIDVVFEELALFGEATRYFGDSLELTVGLRAYRNTADGQVQSSGPLTAQGNLASDGQTRTTNKANLTERGINPRLAIQYRGSDWFSAYAAVARGFRFGGPQLLGETVIDDVPKNYKSDTLWNYELGIRTQWLEDTMFADLTAFYVDWKDPQLQQTDTTQSTLIIDNVGGARSQGLELALQYLPPVDGLSLNVVGAYVDTVTTEFFVTSSGAQIEPGSPWPYASKWSSAVTLNYSRPVGSWLAGLSLVHAHTGPAFNSLEQSVQVFDFSTLDLRLSLARPSVAGAPVISLGLSNLTNQAGLVGGSISDLLPDRTYIRPRTMTLRIGADF